MRGVGALMVAMLACAQIAEAREDRTFTFTSRRVLPVSGETRLEIANRTGEVTVVPSSDGHVTVSIEKRISARDEAEAARIDKTTIVETGTAGGVISVRVKYPRISRKVGIFHIDALGLNETVVLSIAAPPLMALSLNTASADVVVRAMRGPVDLDMTSGDAQLVNLGSSVDCTVTSGDLEVRGAAGPVEVQGTSCDLRLSGISKSTIVRTSSGDVTARGLGAVSVKTTSGTIRLRDVGTVDVQSSSGDVSILGGKGRARIRTVSGECDVDLSPRPGDSIEINSTSGDVTVRVPPAGGLDVGVATTSGTITSRVPMRVRTATRSELAGRVGKGGASLSVSTVSGTVVIDRSME